MTPMDRYLAELERGELLPDDAQRRAVEHTQRLYEQLTAATELGVIDDICGWRPVGLVG